MLNRQLLKRSVRAVLFILFFMPTKRSCSLQKPRNHLWMTKSQLQSWTKVLGLCISRAFSKSHRSNPSPHPTNNVGRVYPELFFEFQLCVGVGGKRNARDVRKGCIVLRAGTEEMTERYEYCSTVQRILSRIVGVLQMSTNHYIKLYKQQK